MESSIYPFIGIIYFCGVDLEITTITIINSSMCELYTIKPLVYRYISVYKNIRIHLSTKRYVAYSTHKPTRTILLKEHNSNLIFLFPDS